MKTLKYIIAVMAALTISASFVGCSGDEDSSSNNVTFYDESNEYVAPGEEKLKAMENAVTATAEMNQEAEIVGCTAVAKQVISLGSREADVITPYSTEMYAVEIEFTNNTEETIDINSMQDFEILVDGLEVSGMDLNADLLAMKTIEGYKTLDFELAAGETTIGYVAFSAKTDWKEIKMTYRPLIENMNYDALIYTITPDMIQK